MKQLLSSTAFIVLNKELAKQVGLKEAVLLADLISKEEYFISKGMTDGWFFNTEANIEADTTLNSYHQRKCLKTLKKFKIIETKRKGIPAKQYFKINEEQVIKILNNLSDKNQTTINKNKEIKINNNTISNRRSNFEKEVFNSEYHTDLCKEFFDYWSEPNKSNTKMKFELNKTWKTSLRLKTWYNNQKKWDKPKSNTKTMSKLDAQINEWQKAKELL
jgi:hypothetical protein